MKKLIILLAVVSVHATMAQNVRFDKEGTAHFFSEAPLENIEATNEKAIGAFDLDKGTIAISILIKDFHFERSLMEEHFNENYMESEKYPKAKFKGAIQDFADLDLSKTGTFTAKAEGELEIHGVTKPLVCDVEFEIVEDSISAKTSFKVALEDHQIKIPKLVIKNIAEVVDVDATFKFSRK